MSGAQSPRFFDDDPLWIDRDTEDASRMKPLEVNLVVDLTYNMIKGRADVVPTRAKNLNTVDEVADSSWFTNRAGHRSLTPEDVFRGPDTSDGPASGTWTVTSSKSDGVTPGFTVKDSSGQRWFLKFDPPGYRAMATGTEVAVTKLMWALGYNVPENHIAYMRREQLVVGNGAKFTPAGGNERLMRLGDIDNLLDRANREADGSYRVVASKSLEGKPIGRIRFMGTRPDDPNDLIAHEDRRELRGYGVFAAWLNHVDAKAINSLDMLITKDGRSFVRHNLIDFGSTLGSGGVGPADYWEGEQYLVEPASIGRQMIGFGFSYPTWHTTPFYEAHAVGRLPMHNASFNAERLEAARPEPGVPPCARGRQILGGTEAHRAQDRLTGGRGPRRRLRRRERRALPGAGVGRTTRCDRARLPDRHQSDRRPDARCERHAGVPECGRRRRFCPHSRGISGCVVHIRQRDRGDDAHRGDDEPRDDDAGGRPSFGHGRLYQG